MKLKYPDFLGGPLQSTTEKNISDLNAADLVSGVVSDSDDCYLFGSCGEGEFQNRVIFANKLFAELTGFDSDQVSGEAATCSFLFGPHSRPQDITRVQDAVSSHHYAKVTMLLYRKNGTTFMGTLEFSFIRNYQNEVALMLVVLKLVLDCKPDVDQVKIERIYQQSMRQRLRHLSEKRNITKIFRKQLHSDDSSTTEETSWKEKSTDEKNSKKCLISHNGTFKLFWDWLVMVATFYTGVAAPYDAVFVMANNEQEPLPLIIADMLINFIFIIDLGINFRTTYPDMYGATVTDTKIIAQQYITSWFAFDLVACIPFDLLYVFGAKVTKVIILLKCVRLLRILRLFSKIERYTQYGSVILLINVVIYVLLAHWMACLWFLIGDMEYKDLNPDWNCGWVAGLARRVTNEWNINKPKVELSPMMLYATSIYFTTTLMTSVGFGNESPNTVTEKLFSVIAMLLGAMMHAVVFGNVTAIIQRLYARRFSHDVRNDELKAFFRMNHIPKPLRRTIHEFYETSWTVNRGIDHEKLISDLPEELRIAVCLHLYRDFLSLPLFADATPGCRKSIALHLKRAFVNNKELLLHKGDVIENLYYIVSGSLEVVQDGAVVSAYAKGDLLGTSVFQTHSRSNADVRALSYCDFYCISLEMLSKTIRLYPELAVHFPESLQRILSYNLGEDADGNVEKFSMLYSNMPTPSSLKPRSLSAGRRQMQSFIPHTAYNMGGYLGSTLRSSQS